MKADLIRRLEKQATKTVPHERDWDSETTEFDRFKFAELIVEECLSAVRQELNAQSKAHVLTHVGGLDQAISKIKERFG